MKAQNPNGVRDDQERCLPCETARGSAEPEFARWVTRLVHDHRASLARVARGEGLLAEDAFDTVQEAFRSFLVRPDAAELVTRPEAARKLLVALTRNLARNRRRLHAGARPHLSDASVVEQLPDAAPSSEQVLESIELHEQLARCVGELGEAQRAVVNLRMLDEVPGEDVARMLGIAPGHVAVLLHRAKGNLATCMAAAADLPHANQDDDAMVASGEGGSPAGAHRGRFGTL
ncbi:MAG TPA: sigma-70 family RNA polymerase sigma factor [Polyangia bacterium]|nr:sigma-70 family RNA polymerase sigma factor [Polyangia bacterium]